MTPLHHRETSRNWQLLPWLTCNLRGSQQPEKASDNLTPFSRLWYLIDFIKLLLLSWSVPKSGRVNNQCVLIISLRAWKTIIKWSIFRSKNIRDNRHPVTFYYVCDYIAKMKRPYPLDEAFGLWNLPSGLHWSSLHGRARSGSTATMGSKRDVRGKRTLRVSLTGGYPKRDAASQPKAGRARKRPQFNKTHWVIKNCLQDATFSKVQFSSEIRQSKEKSSNWKLYYDERR